MILLLPLLAAAPQGRISYIPYADAKPVVEGLTEVLPAELREATPDQLVALWPEWVKRRDAEIRTRLARGDEDTVVNFLLFGTSFTQAARFSPARLKLLLQARTSNAVSGPEAAAVAELLQQRVHDLLRGMAAPGTNERLLFAREVAERAGAPLGSGKNGASRAREYVLANVGRVLKEQSSFQEALAAAHSLGDSTEEFAERSKLYKERGLSLDTSILPDYALEVALRTMRDRELLKAGSVRRVGIIGPGLDFTDKQEGFDFYPLQTVQPFAVMDSLLRLGLARRQQLEVASLDLSPRVNEHVERVRRAALKGRGYSIQLPRDPARGWKPGAVAYWEKWGDQIGEPATPVAVPAALRGVTVRAVRVRPDLVRRVSALDVNIVLQRQDAPAVEKFDLLVATNIFVYYDTFEQSLALANVEAMLRPGGFLLTNNLLLELPSSRMKSLDYVDVPYSGHEADGDHILWYRRER